MSYATVSELSNFTGIPEIDLPADTNRMLQRASELVDFATMNRINATDTVHMEAAKKATCAQVEYWIEVDESMDKIGAPEAFNIGSFSMNGKLPELSQRARRILFLAGLLYRGVSMK
jgi:hypothetical protein